jgi:hypothetical protein
MLRVPFSTTHPPIFPPERKSQRKKKKKKKKEKEKERVLVYKVQVSITTAEWQ